MKQYNLPKGYEIKAKWKEGDKEFVIGIRKVDVLFLQRTMFVFDGVSDLPTFIIQIASF